jgi:hypothetical protein
MHVERVPDAASFLDRSAGLRAQEPLLTNVIGSVAQLARRAGVRAGLVVARARRRR